MNGVKLNDPLYRPYCLRCSTMIRMAIIAENYWRCTKCDAVHDERTATTEPTR